ncbi:Uncharacterised protein [Vibrio cholerae]|nr:Uncharacterised protein [Vibrio cholerae]
MPSTSGLSLTAVTSITNCALLSCAVDASPAISLPALPLSFTLSVTAT